MSTSQKPHVLPPAPDPFAIARREPAEDGDPTAIYGRMSADPEGRALGIERQLEDCHALTERLGLRVVKVYAENDISASTNSKKPRPDYAEMLRLARDGEIRVIVSYSNSRLTRRPRELEDLLELHREYGTRIVTVASGEDDLSTADGRMVARYKGVADTAEAERISERCKRAKRQAAAAGRHRGGPRPFGWESDGMTVRPGEARALLKAAKGVLAGRSLAAIARELNDAGFTTAAGKPWTYGTVVTALCRPRNAGLVSHGRAERPGVEIVGPAAWPAIIPEDVWRATRDVLTSPDRRERGQWGTEKRWLGSGIYRCGVCREAHEIGTLRAASAPSQRGARAAGREPSRWVYRCRESAHLTVAQLLADGAVLEATRARLAKRDLLDLLTVDEADHAEPLRAEREALRARLAVFEADYAQGLITGAQLASATGRTEAEIRQIEGKLSRLVGAGPLAPLARSADPVAQFDAYPLDAQRAVVDALMTVTILPAGGTRLSLDRVRIDWKTL